MPDFKELVKNLYTSKNRELTPEKLDYITKNYSGKEDDFVKNFYTTIGEDLTPDKLSYIKDTYLKKKDNIQRGYQFGSETLPIGSKPSQTQVDTSIPSVLNPKEATQYKEQVNIEAQKKRDLSQQLQSAKNVYYQAQGDANSFSLYDGYQSAIKNIDDEISKNYPDEATVSRTVSGQEDFKKYKTKRDELVSERERLRQESNNALLYINPKIESKINSDLKNNGLDSYTRNVNGFKVADEFKIDDYAKKIAEESGLANDGTFKQLVYNKLKSTVSSNIIKPKIEKEFNLESKKLGLDDAVQKEYLNNFIEGKKIQSNLILQVESLNNEIKTKVNDGAKSLLLEYKPIFESFTVDYKNKASELESKIKQLNDSYKSGIIPRQDYELSFNDIQNKLNLLNTEYQQGFESVSKDYLNSQNELYSKYDKKYKRQVSEFKSMADQQISDASKKYGKSFKMSDELNKKFQFAWSEATKKSLSKEEAIKYELDKTSLLNNIGGQFVKNLFMGIGGGIKSISSMYDFDTGYVLGDYMENSFVSSSPEIKSALDLLDPIKLQTSTGRMIGGMAPILGASALTAAATKNAPTALRLLTTGLGNYLIETAQIGGGVKDQVFQKTGNIADANKAAKKVIDANLYLLPLYALDGLPFLGNVTLGIGNTFARAGAKAGIEVITELPQEYFQGIFEDLAVANRPISQTFEEMSLERFENTALNVIPTSVLLGGGGTAIKGVRENISKIQGRSLAAKVNLSNLTETTKKQFIYDTVLRRGDVFSKAYVSSLFNSGNINEQELESFSKIIEDSSNINAESKKIGLNKAQSKVYAALRFDYLQSKNEFDSEQDEVSKKLYKAKMDSAEKSLTNYISGGKPDAVLLTLPNNEQYIYSFETLNSIINEGGETLNQIINGEISVGLLSDKSNPKAKELSDKLIQAKKDAIKIETAGEVPTATIGAMVEEDKVSDERLVQDVENYFTDNTRSTQDSKYNPDLSGEGELALQEQEDALLQLGADRIQAHGLAKGSIGQQFKDLINILTNGLDSRGDGQLYTAPLVMPAEMRAGAGAALGTGGGTAYTDGGFIILAREGVNEIRNVNDIGGVLVNQAIADTLPELIDRLKKAFPNISIESYSNAPKAIESIQSLEKLKPKENAIQVETAGEVPVQPKAKVGEEVVKGKPEPEAEIAAKESVKAKEVENLPALNKQLKLLQDKFTRLEKKYEQTEDPAIQLQLDKINEESAVLSAKIEAIETKEQAPKTVESETAELEKLFADITSPSIENKGVSVTNKSAINQVKTKSKDSNRVKIIESAQKLLKTLQSVLPNFDIVIHDNEGSYNASMSEVNGLSNSAGNFSYVQNQDGSYSGRIDINLNIANARTVAHEVAHGIMLKAFGDNPPLFKNFRDKISKVLSESSNKGLMDFANQYKGDVAYEEYLVELSAMLSEQEAKISPTTLQKIAAVINDIVSRLTKGSFKPFEDIKNTNDIIDFFNNISESIREGSEIQQLNTKEPYSSGVTLPIINPDEFIGKKFKSKASIGDYKFPSEIDALKIADIPIKNLTELIRQYKGRVVIITSDATGYGVDKNGDPILGGFGFASNEKNVSDGIGFASVSTGTVKSTYTAAEKAYGIGKSLVLIMIQPPHTTINNSYGAKYIIRGIKEIASSSKEDLIKTKKAIIDFIKGSKAIQQELKTNPASLKRGSEKRLFDLINNIDENINLEEFVNEFLLDTTFTIRKELAKGIILENKNIRTNKSTNYSKIALNNVGYNIYDFLKEYGDNTILTDDLILNNTGGYVAGGFELNVLPKDQRESLIDSIQNKGIVHPLFNAKLPGTNHFRLDGLYDVQENFSKYARPDTEISLSKEDRDNLVREIYKDDKFYNADARSIPLEKRSYTNLTVPAKIEFKDKYLKQRGFLAESVPNVPTKVAKGEGFIPIENAAKQMSKGEFVSKAQLSPSDIVEQLVSQARDKGLSDNAIETFLKNKGFDVNEIKTAMGKIIELPKLDESNVENAIELLDDIEDNKRKVERASSRMKANLEQKIAEAQSELDKIPDEAKIVKVINDNFDKIKKDLKEQGILNVKC